MKRIVPFLVLPIMAALTSCASGPATAPPAAAPPGPSQAPVAAPPAAAPAPFSADGAVANLDPAQAYALMRSDPTAVLLDVRTQAEYVFVGHPAGALNIPLEFWDEATDRWSQNPAFDARVQARVPKDRPVILMCRSGNRSRTAAERLLQLGYARVFNMTESFEGDADPATRLRTVNGWKNRGLPWTYAVDPALYYRP